MYTRAVHRTDETEWMFVAEYGGVSLWVADV